MENEEQQTQANETTDTEENLSDAEIVMNEIMAKREQEEPKKEPEEATTTEAPTKIDETNETSEAKKESDPEKEELQKRLAEYEKKEAETKEQIEQEAKNKGFNSVHEKQISEDILYFEASSIYEAINKGYAGEKSAEAIKALEKFVETEDIKDLNEVKRFLSPETIEKIANNKRDYEFQRNEELKSENLKKDYEKVKTNLENFVKETGAWLDGKARSELVSFAIKNFGANTDFNLVKSFVDKIEAQAIENYEKGKELKAKQNERLSELASPTSARDDFNSTDKWFSKDEIEGMSEAEYLKNAGKITLQMSLEKEGKLPKTIIN